jgi:thiol-disulfide isomerase/thioredoxin
MRSATAGSHKTRDKKKINYQIILTLEIMKKIYFTCLVLTCLLHVYCDSINAQPQRTIIGGRITNYRSDTLTLQFYTRRLGITRAGARVQKVTTGNGEFRFVLPQFTEIAYITLVSSVWPRVYIDKYLVEPGDSVFVTIDPEGVRATDNFKGTGMRFSGSNTGNFIAQHRLDSSYELIYRAAMKAGPPKTKRQPRFDSLYNEQREYREAYLAGRLQVLELSAKLLSPLAYEVMKADIVYQSLVSTLMQFGDAWGNLGKYPDSVDRLQSLRDFYTSRLATEPESGQTSSQAKQYSWGYLDFLVRRVMTAARLVKGRGGNVDASSYHDLISRLDPDLQQLVYTTLAAYMYSFSPGATGMEEYQQTILKKVLDPYLQSVLNDFQSFMSKGMPAFPFSLPDASGKTVSLAGLNGKIVLIDFWFTHCIPCMQLARALRKVKEIVRSNSNIVFVSISADDDKATWLNSLKAGLYTEQENINLYTEGLGRDHPVFTHYKCTAFPRVLLIDKKGRILSGNLSVSRDEAGIAELASTLLAAEQQK